MGRLRRRRWRRAPWRKTLAIYREQGSSNSGLPWAVQNKRNRLGRTVPGPHGWNGSVRPHRIVLTDPDPTHARTHPTRQIPTPQWCATTQPQPQHIPTPTPPTPLLSPLPASLVNRINASASHPSPPTSSPLSSPPPHLAVADRPGPALTARSPAARRPPPPPGMVHRAASPAPAAAAVAEEEA
ncbi:hypothetical protein DAI22_08g020032 [Oryza sativa Japonica Group]|nr:hypothetical protein DAI22_08g020032 [Oryza sativa Japonica Group]